MGSPQPLVNDVTIRQCLLELGHARVGDLGVVEEEPLQTGQSLKMHQPCVRDLGAEEVDLNNFSLFIQGDNA